MCRVQRERTWDSTARVYTLLGPMRTVETDLAHLSVGQLARINSQAAVCQSD